MTGPVPLTSPPVVQTTHLSGTSQGRYKVRRRKVSAEACAKDSRGASPGAGPISGNVYKNPPPIVFQDFGKCCVFVNTFGRKQGGFL